LVCEGGLKAKWIVASFDAMYKIEHNVQKIQLPFLTLHGTRDRVVSITSSHFLMEHAPSEDKTIKVIVIINKIWSRGISLSKKFLAGYFL